MTALPPLFKHQEKFVNMWLANDKIANFGDAGTGKTRSVLETLSRRKQKGKGRRTLVLAPLSILESAWGEDCEKWTPHLSYSVAYAKNRAKAFAQPTDIVVTNHDAVKWILKNPAVLVDFDTLVIDESTAFKNHGSARTKAMFEIAEAFDYITILSGTPTSNGILDIWAQVFILDYGERLGNYYSFRNQVSYPKQTGPNPNMVQWIDRPEAEEKTMLALSDIVFRVRLEDAIDMPENSVSTIKTKLPPSLLKKYYELMNTSMLELDNGQLIDAVHAGARVKKLLQLCSGSLYDETGTHQFVHTERYELVIELVEQRPHSIVAFNWKHERDQLIALATKKKISYAVIDGDVKPEHRARITRDFQDGKLQVIFAHPQSAGHGLTLTKGTATIWASPTYNAEHFQQLNRRIYRAGQTKRTETILIAASGTWEETVYEKLGGKVDRMDALLHLFAKHTAAA